jgi:hypothetical protein
MRDDFSTEVKRVIANRANLICSNPNCRSSTAGPQDDASKALNIGVVAYIITAASVGGLVRPDTHCGRKNIRRECQMVVPELCEARRQRESLYPAEVLRAWKTLREHDARICHRTDAISRRRNRRSKEAARDSHRKGQQVMCVKMANQRKAMSLGPRPWNQVRIAVLDCTDL